MPDDKKTHIPSLGVRRPRAGRGVNPQVLMKVLAKREAKKEREADESKVRCERLVESIENVMKTLLVNRDVQSVILPNEYQEYILKLKKQKEANIQQELVKWEKLQLLKELQKMVEENPEDHVSLALLSVYTKDALLTADAALTQEDLLNRAKLLGKVAIAILIAFPFALSLLAFTAGSPLGMAITLSLVLLSKIEGILAFCTTMKIHDASIRKTFDHAEDAICKLKEKENLSPDKVQLLKFNDFTTQQWDMTNAKEDSNLLTSNAIVLNKVKGMLEFYAQRDDSLLTTPFDNIIVEINSLINETKSSASQDQSEVIELLPYLLRLTEEPLNPTVIDELDQKAKEIWDKVDARKRQELIKTIGKIILFASLIITVACIANIFFAMTILGAAVTSAIVLKSDSIIVASKGIFWLGGVIAASGSVNAKHYQANAADKKSDGIEKKMDISKLSSLQKISLFTQQMCQSAAKDAKSNVPNKSK